MSIVDLETGQGVPEEYVKVEVGSGRREDVSSEMDGQRVVQRQIDYLIWLNGRAFLVPGVWSLVSEDEKEVYFEPEVGKGIDESIFLARHPRTKPLSQVDQDE